MDRLRKLFLKAKNNDRYFEKLYKETVDLALRYFSARLKTRADVEDLTQEFYLKLYRSLKDYRDSGSPYAFFYSIARSVYVDWLKKLNKDYFLTENLELYHQESQKNEDTDRKIDIEKGLNKLREDEREIILLYFFDGLKNEEIAEILGISVENVKVKKHRALKKLREEMKEYG
ncbi:MAG: RNA polymerase sigma factor [Actinobacteria bacterium]|nr:RNA polymerase sigma factor [Actinomycetota bacterium]